VTINLSLRSQKTMNMIEMRAEEKTAGFRSSVPIECRILHIEELTEVYSSSRIAGSLD